MDNASYDAAGTAILFGAAIIYIAIFFPSVLRFLPYNRWFRIGPVASRVAAVLIACAIVLFGLVLGQVIPMQYKGLAFVCCATLIVAAGLYDLSRAGRD